uniref:DUF7794 domain-containing protein n=1 Tax=Picocystis salinarum TaxID=88271 RepID=A0A7S3XES9_9CHLO
MLRIAAAFAMLGSIGGASGAQVAYVSGPGGTYFQASQEERTKDRTVDEEVICGTAASLLDVHPGFAVSDAVAKKVDGVVNTNPFIRPKTLISLYVLNEGDVQEAAEQLKGLHPEVYHLTVDDGNVAGSMVQFGLAKRSEIGLEYLTCSVGSECGAKCQEQALQDVVQHTEAAYVPSTQPLQGVLKLMKNDVKAEVDLKDIQTRSWASEIACLWHAISIRVADWQVREKTMERSLPRSSLLHGSMTTGALLRSEWGGEAEQSIATRLFEWEVAAAVATLARGVSGGEVALQIITLSESRDHFSLVNGHLKAGASSAQRRRELAPMWYGGALFGNNKELTASEWLAQTVMWVGGIIALVAACCGCCCMYHMPLQKDTLLYKKGKLD